MFLEFYEAIGKDIFWLMLVNLTLLQVLIISKYRVKNKFKVKVRRDDRKDTTLLRNVQKATTWLQLPR